MGQQPDHDNPRNQGKEANGEEEALFEGIHPTGFFSSFVHGQRVAIGICRRVETHDLGHENDPSAL
jgi:hypothetical protein